MNKAGYLFAGMGIGAGVMFILDPDRGRRRRALVRDKAVSTWNQSEQYAEKMARDLANRSRGVYYETKAAMTGKERNPVHEHSDRSASPETWSPATRLIASAMGGGLALYGFRRGGLLGKGVTALGMGLLTRGMTNEAMQRGGALGRVSDKVASAVGSQIESMTGNRSSQHEDHSPEEQRQSSNPYGNLSPLTPSPSGQM
jgi:hypothetical protein